MAVRKSLTERVVINGDRALVMQQCRKAMTAGGFKKVTVNEALFQISGKVTKMSLAGRLDVTLSPTVGGTEMVMRSTGNVDNVYAAFRSPNQKILKLFKDNL